MAAPAAARSGASFSKSTTAGSFTCAPSPTSFSLNDILLVGLEADPNVVFGTTTITGTATIGSFTTEIDITNGSAAAGVRLLMYWAKVTAAGTITSVVINNTIGTAARAAAVYQITGADSTTPVGGKASSNAGGNTVTVTNPGRDICAIAIQAVENAGLVATDMAQWSGMTGVAVDTTTIGSTGSTAATNVCASQAIATTTNAPSSLTGPVGTTPTGTRTYGYLLFQAPAAAAGFSGWGIPIN